MPQPRQKCNNILNVLYVDTITVLNARVKKETQ